jgi:hypothetical protein
MGVKTGEIPGSGNNLLGHDLESFLICPWQCEILSLCPKNFKSIKSVSNQDLPNINNYILMCTINIYNH